MNRRIHFHLDEQVKSVIARELRRRGVDVTTTVEVGLRTILALFTVNKERFRLDR